MSDSVINTTIEYVKSILIDAEGGHDWQHTFRVWENAKRIAATEDVDQDVVELASLLHDIADSKFHDGDESIGPRLAKEYLNGASLSIDKIEHVISIMKNMSFKNSIEGVSFNSLEMQVVQDADRLDAIGAVGIARAFNYGGFKNRLLFDPDVFPNLNMSKEEYKKSTAPTINHFYEKLLLLKDRMNTNTGKLLAQERHDFMLQYLQQFYNEVGVSNWPE